MKFVIFKDKAKQFRWRLVAANNRIIATSGEGYKRKGWALLMIAKIKNEFAAFEVPTEDKTK